MNWPRVILHVDMDAFFAAIAVLDHPELRGKPILTGGDGPRGVVSTASYEARKFGCRSAMPMAVAKRLCPQATVVQVPGKRIREMSDRLFRILHDMTPLVEPLSVDEAFLDVTGSLSLMGDPITIAQTVRNRVRNELQLTASVGVSFNKFLAKLASDMDKPDGLTVIGPERVDEILLPLPVERIWGVGPATAERLHERGIYTIADLRQQSEAQLRRWFGELGDRFYRLSRGRDTRPVVPDHQAKSIGQEQTFPEDVPDADYVRQVLMTQTEQVGRRLRRHGLRAGGVTVKIRYGDFQTITRSAALSEPSDLTEDLWQHTRTLFDRWVRQSFEPVRLIGVAADRLTTEPRQMSLFTDPQQTRRRQLNQTLDRIVEKFGETAIHRGSRPPRQSPIAPRDRGNPEQ